MGEKIWVHGNFVGIVTFIFGYSINVGMASVLTQNWKIVANKAIKAVLFSIIPIVLPFVIYLVKGELADYWFYLGPIIYAIEEIILKAVSKYKPEYDHFEWALKPVGDLISNSLVKIKNGRNNGDG